MSLGRSERRKRLIKGFMQLRQDGKTIAEIAKYFQVSTWTVYQSLQEIADANGVNREELLYVVQESHVVEKGSSRRKTTTRIAPEEIRKEFIDLLKMVDVTVEAIDKALQEGKEHEENVRC